MVIYDRTLAAADTLDYKARYGIPYVRETSAVCVDVPDGYRGVTAAGGMIYASAGAADKQACPIGSYSFTGTGDCVACTTGTTSTGVGSIASMA